MIPSREVPVLEPGEHAHRCLNPVCGHKWKHRTEDVHKGSDLVDLILDIIGARGPHVCACCGKPQIFKWRENVNGKIEEYEDSEIA